MKKPTLKEKVQMYEGLLHDIQMYASVTLDITKMKRLVSNISDWSYAHRAGNGELTHAERAYMIANAFWRLRDTTN